MVVEEKIIEEITNKAVKKVVAEMEQVKSKAVSTPVGKITLASAEMDESTSLEFYINVPEVSDTWKESKR